MFESHHDMLCFGVAGSSLRCKPISGCTWSLFTNVRHGSVFLSRRDMTLKDNSTMDKTEAQIVSYGILYLKFHPVPTCIQEVYCCLNTSLQTQTGGGHFSLLIASNRAIGATKSIAATLMLMT